MWRKRGLNLRARIREEAISVAACDLGDALAREPGDHHVCVLDVPCGVCHNAMWVGPA